MSMTGGGATANVNIKVDVDDAGAEARLAALEKRLKALEQSSKGASGASKSFNNDLDNMSRTSKRLSGDHDKLAKTGETLKNMFGRLGKFAKFAGIEFLGFTAALAAMKLALIAGQYAMKGFHALLRGTGAAAGVAIAAIGTVLAAMRELQAATMAPLMGGMKESRSQMNAVYADRRFAMFDAKTMGSIIQSAASQGKTIDAAFRNQLARYADYAMGDPKKLAEIQKTMMQAEKDKKITAKTYADLQQSAPMLAKAFDEMAGGTAKGAAAAKAGTISYAKFFAAVNEGKLKALLPFNGALEQINNTLIGRLKASFRGIKEQLTRLGEPFLKTFQGPINVVEREISTFVLKINGTLQKVFPQLFKIGDSNNNIITRMFDKLANSINANMGNIVNWGDKIRSMGAAIRNFFSGMGASLTRLTAGWDKLYKNILKPIAKVIGENLVYALTKFNGLIEGQSLGGFTVAIENFGDILHNVIDGLFQLKAVLAPILQMFLGLSSVVASLTGGPFKMLIPLLLMGRMMGGGRMGGKGAAGAAGMGMMAGGLGMGAGPLGMLAMPLMMGMSGFGARTQGAATSNANYATNRAAGAGILPSALFSGQRGGQFAQNMRSGMGFGTSFMTSASKGVAGAYGGAYNASLAASMQARIQNVREGDYGALSKLHKDPAALRALDLTSKGGFLHDATTGTKLTDAQHQQTARELNPLRYGGAREQALKDAKDQAKLAGKAQAKEFVKGSAKQFGKSAGMMAATVGATMLGSVITKRAGTNQGMAAAGGALSGAGMGASMGAAFGPYGMLAGAIGGALIGGISASKNAEKLQKQQRATSISSVNAAIFDGRTFNTEQDFIAAREGAYGAKSDIDKLVKGSATNLDDRIKKETFNRDAARLTAQERFQEYVKNKTGATSVTGTTKSRRALGGFAPGIHGASSAFKFEGGTFGGQKIDSEDNRMERLAQDFLVDEYGVDRASAASAMDGKGKGKGAFGAIDALVGASYDGSIELLNKDLKELKEKYPDVAVASETYKKALADLAEKQKAFTTNSQLTGEITSELGINMDQVADLFTKTGRSLSDTLPGIEDFNKLIGMVGDTATRIANGAGRFGRSLFAQTQQDMDVAESRSRLETQLQTLLGTKGTVSASEGTRVAGETLNEIVNNSMAEMSAGNVSFEQLTGKPGENGMLQNQLLAVLEQAKKRGVAKNVISQLENSIYGEVDATTGERSGGMLDQINNSKTDPFARMQYDGKFSTEFEAQMKAASDAAAMAIQGGTDIGEAVNDGTTSLAKWLQSQGITVDQGTMDRLQTMLGGTMQNSASAMQKAMFTGGAYAAQAILAAMTGGVVPPPPVTTPIAPVAPPVTGTGPGGGVGTAPSGNLYPYTDGELADTTTSRFSQTLAAHSSFNAMTPGKRLVTSGIRNTNVGSMNSDHITGRAFDLTGDNLVSYSQNVKEAGGFAEFHGGPGEQRHLHVVPPVGDSSSSYVGGGGGGSTSNYYTIEVNASAGMDEESLANKVLDKIKRAERTSSERR